MTLPRVRVRLDASRTGEVWVNDRKLPGVVEVTVHGKAGGLPVVQVGLRPGTLDVDLPETSVQLSTTVQGSAVGFLQSLNPAALQSAIESTGDMDSTFGETVLAVLRPLAARHDEQS